jgi:hypothetical protein
MSILCRIHPEGAVYLCNEQVSTEWRRAIALNEKSSHAFIVEHYHCLSCKQKVFLGKKMISSMRRKNDLYIPGMDCEELCKWRPSEK